MALDEYLFGRVMRYFRTRKTGQDADGVKVLLEGVKPRLTILARAFTGQPVELFPAIKEGGYKGNSFFLPEHCDHYSSYETNLSFYLFRILFLSVQQKLRYNWYRVEPLPDHAALLNARQHAPQVLHALFDEYPLAHDLHHQLLAEAGEENNQGSHENWLYGKWMADTPAHAPLQDIQELPAGGLLAHPKDLPETIMHARPVEEIINLAVDIRQQEDYVLTHNFEKVETADEFSGSWRDFDGEDELESHQDALDELTMKYTVRVNDTVHSVYETGYTGNANVAESKEAVSEGHYVLYDEWDCYKKRYRKDHSKVYPVRQPFADAAYYEQTILDNKLLLNQLRKMLTSLSNKWQQQRLQAQGREIDADMATDRYADLVAGHTPSDRIYISDRKKETELSLLLLIDLSLSSDSYAAGNRVIDVARQTAILFGEILNEFGIDFSIYGFYSKTRNYTAYVTLKDFDDKWSLASTNVGGPQPEGYTRIGPALRHSGALLRERPAKNKWLILLSDGKPNDFDRYEGRYGMGDVKQALRELGANQVNTYALAIEAAARHYLPQMFGQDHYQVISSPTALFTTLIKLYDRIRYSG